LIYDYHRSFHLKTTADNNDSMPPSKAIVNSWLDKDFLW
jgi:hypothetical protein